MANRIQKIIVKTTDNELLPTIKESLKKYGKVKVTGLGIFEAENRQARIVTLPGTAHKMKLKAYKRVNFRASQKIKDFLNK